MKLSSHLPSLAHLHFLSAHCCCTKNNACFPIPSALSHPSLQVPARNADPKGRLYKIAARNLREYNGVPSMTPAKLTTTLALLKLGPRRLVQQGLAPRVLLARMRAVEKEGATQEQLGGGDDEHLAASVASGMEVMSLENEEGRKAGCAAVDQPAAADDVDLSSASDDEHDEQAAIYDSSTDEDENDDPAAAPGDSPGAVKKNLLHKAFVDEGVQLRPREVRPLLLALAVQPCRLARLGLVDAKDLRAILHAERKKANKRNGGRGRGGGDGMGEHAPLHPHHPPHHHPHHPRHQDMARGGPGGAPHGPRGPLSGFPRGPPGFMMRRRGGGVGGRGGGGGRRGPVGPGAGGKMMRRHHAHPPPPPPPHMDEEDDGMFDAPDADVDGPPHPHPHHPPHDHPMEEGEGGPGFHHGPPPGMRVRNRMRRARNGGGGGGGGGGQGQPTQQGYQYGG
ncbi:unnamed protein product [Scytosiphon promiscuus]